MPKEDSYSPCPCLKGQWGARCALLRSIKYIRQSLLYLILIHKNSQRNIILGGFGHKLLCNRKRDLTLLLLWRHAYLSNIIFLFWRNAHKHCCYSAIKRQNISISCLHHVSWMKHNCVCFFYSSTEYKVVISQNVKVLFLLRDGCHSLEHFALILLFEA